MIQITPRAESMTQDRAISFWNERNTPMMSMADVWQVAKENNSEVIEDLRKDWKGWYWQVTSTRIIYDVSSLKGKVIHNFGSTVVKQTEIALDEIPVCQPTYLEELVESKAGLEYLRALLNDMNAEKEDIIKLLESLSGKKKEKIRFWTPTKKEKLNRPLRAVWLCFYDDRFLVYGSSWLDFNVGISRGVRLINSAPKEQHKSKKDQYKEGYNQAVKDMMAKLEKFS